MNNATTRFYTFAAMIFAAALSRVLPHPSNVAPITAMALFAGAFIDKRATAIAVPLLSMAASDIALEILTGWGFYSGMWTVYLTLALIALLGFRLRTKRSLARIAGYTTAGSAVFFFLTNFAVWALGTMYPHSLEGFIACYVAALPFFQNSLIGDFAYSALLFGGFALAERAFPALHGEAKS